MSKQQINKIILMLGYLLIITAKQGPCSPGSAMCEDSLLFYCNQNGKWIGINCEEGSKCGLSENAIKCVKNDEGSCNQGNGKDDEEECGKQINKNEGQKENDNNQSNEKDGKDGDPGSKEKAKQKDEVDTAKESGQSKNKDDNNKEENSKSENGSQSSGKKEDAKDQSKQESKENPKKDVGKTDKKEKCNYKGKCKKKIKKAKKDYNDESESSSTEYIYVTKVAKPKIQTIEILPRHGCCDEKTTVYKTVTKHVMPEEIKVEVNSDGRGLPLHTPKIVYSPHHASPAQIHEFEMVHKVCGSPDQQAMQGDGSNQAKPEAKNATNGTKPNSSGSASGGGSKSGGSASKSGGGSSSGSEAKSAAGGGSSAAKSGGESKSSGGGGGSSSSSEAKSAGGGGGAAKSGGDSKSAGGGGGAAKSGGDNKSSGGGGGAAKSGGDSKSAGGGGGAAKSGGDSKPAGGGGGDSKPAGGAKADDKGGKTPTGGQSGGPSADAKPGGSGGGSQSGGSGGKPSTPGGGGGGANLTSEQLSEAVTSAGYEPPDETALTAIVESVNESMDSIDEAAMFIAQCIHESEGFKYTEEIACKDNPESCAQNYWDDAGIQGKSYHGRGYIQLSWPANYKAAGEGLGMGDELLQNPEQVAEDPKMAIATAVWFWVERVRPEGGVENKQFGATTKAINGPLECGGGSDVPAKRYEIYKKVAEAFGVSDIASEEGC